MVPMKILAIADRPPKRPIRDILAENSIDLIVTLGDLEWGELSELEAIDDIPKIGVYGNHCSKNYFEPLGIENMHLSTKKFGGLVFGGFEGCVRYKKSTAAMYTQEEAVEMMQDFPAVDVFLAHCPPYHVNDGEDLPHEGFVAFNKYIDEKKPRYFLHGHTYPKEESLIRNYLGSTIMYIHEDTIIEIS